ncbi:MAG: hypothetical protein ACRDKB_12680 [Actinomycetota bacterium]
MRWLAGALAIALVGVVAWRWDAYFPTSRMADPPTAAAPGDLRYEIYADPAEPTVYDLAGDRRGCLAGAAAGLRGPRGRPVEGMTGDLARIAQGVATVRRLDFTGPVATRLVTDDEIDEHMTRSVDASFEQGGGRQEERILKALGIIGPRADLKALGRKIVRTQVAGFYVPSTKTIFAPAAGDHPSPFEELILAHELEHALADQRLGLPIREHAPPRKGDASQAKRALIEGDATLTMQQYALGMLSAGDRASLAGDPSVAEAAAATAEIPYFLERSLAFSYDEGALFVCHLYAEGGWKAVNRAYRNPPRSTAEILFPGRYRDEVKPVDPPDPPAPGRGWRDHNVYSFGAADLSWLLSAPQGEPTRTPREGALDVVGWNGGELHAWSRGRKIALVATIALRPASGLCRKLQEWARLAYPGATSLAPGLDGALKTKDLYIQVRCRDDAARLVMAPERTVEALLSDAD